MTELPLPLPPGVDEDALRRTYATWSINGEPAGHMEAYVADSFWRFIHTYGLVAQSTGACLELGANPYFTTYLLDEHTDLSLTLANFYGDAGRGGTITDTLTYTRADGTTTERSYTSDIFNIEEDRFPYEDGTFDVVLFCEIIEHLLMDPVRVLAEIHRVLRPGGTLVLTTPNVCRLANVEAMVKGANIYDPYSGFGPYGRHNREFTRHELHQLLGFAGFDVDVSFTADAHRSDVPDHPGFEEWSGHVRFRAPDLGQYLFARATASRPGRTGLPDAFYRSWPAGTIVPL